MSSHVSTVNSYRYITLSQLKRKLAMTWAESTLKNLRAQVRADLDQGLYLAEGLEKPRGDWTLYSHQAKGKDFRHPLAVTDELIKLEEWSRGYYGEDIDFKFELTPQIAQGQLIPDAEVILQVDGQYAVIYLEVERDKEKPKLERYIEYQNKINERINIVFQYYSEMGKLPIHLLVIKERNNFVG